jgi:hypothetical protein
MPSLNHWTGRHAGRTVRVPYCHVPRADASMSTGRHRARRRTSGTSSSWGSAVTRCPAIRRPAVMWGGGTRRSATSFRPPGIRGLTMCCGRAARAPGLLGSWAPGLLGEDGTADANSAAPRAATCAAPRRTAGPSAGGGRIRRPAPACRGGHRTRPAPTAGSGNSRIRNPSRTTRWSPPGARDPAVRPGCPACGFCG